MFRFKGLNEKDKNYLVKIKYYPCFMFPYLDKWLKKMSLSGWHIVHCYGLLYWFEKDLPEQKEYFTYFTPIRNEGKYNINLHYPFLEKNIAKKKSKINSNKKKGLNIIEVDLNRIDVNNDLYYKELLSDRNKLSLRYYLRNSSLVLFIILVLFFCNR